MVGEEATTKEEGEEEKQMQEQEAAQNQRPRLGAREAEPGQRGFLLSLPAAD